jgi:hypothetical protein
MADASHEFIMRATNGCGRDGLEDILIPDSILWLDISPVCRIHDWDYQNAETMQDEQSADARFAKNLVMLIQQKTKWRWLMWMRLRIAYYYISAVVLTDCSKGIASLQCEEDDHEAIRMIDLPGEGAGDI